MLIKEEGYVRSINDICYVMFSQRLIVEYIMVVQSF